LNMLWPAITINNASLNDAHAISIPGSSRSLSFSTTYIQCREAAALRSLSAREMTR
jgi:hypothetical protein